MPPVKPFEPKGYVCTLVSLLPYQPPPEHKPHILPSTFVIPAADPEWGFGILHVGEGVHFIPDVFNDKNNHRILTPPYEMARSIIEDFSSAQLGIEDGAAPGLFFVEGGLTPAEVKRTCGEQLAAAKLKQENWFKGLVVMADVDWVRNKNAMAVSDLQRNAAKALGLKREWLDITTIETAICPFCKVSVQPDAIKCHSCHEIVNIKLYKEMKESQEKLLAKGFDPSAVLAGAK